MDIICMCSFYYHKTPILKKSNHSILLSVLTKEGIHNKCYFRGYLQSRQFRYSGMYSQ